MLLWIGILIGLLVNHNWHTPDFEGFPGGTSQIALRQKALADLALVAWPP
jgi:hypothetical protein